MFNNEWDASQFASSAKTIAQMCPSIVKMLTHQGQGFVRRFDRLEGHRDPGQTVKCKVLEAIFSLPEMNCDPPADSMPIALDKAQLFGISGAGFRRGLA